ncbi:MAG TPA: heavy-metal-associated domain-containing protein [Candidatus Rubneribacter avistercoris]|nr:heavy-metal-associated domain-containing protein [Candidatus Rubneribacter avistercoris]
MNLQTAVILVIIAVLCVFAARAMYDTFTGKGGCHGGGGASRARRARVADKDEANYPFFQEVKVGGMTCTRCAANVENALNALGDTWARVDLDAKTARVLSKRPLDASEIDKAVTRAGYYIASR